MNYLLHILFKCRGSFFRTGGGNEDRDTEKEKKELSEKRRNLHMK